MNSFTYTLLIIGLSLLSTSIPTSARQWTNTEGKKIEAILLSSTQNSVTIQTPNKKEFTLKKSTLSQQDQDYIKQWQKSKKEEAQKEIAQKLIIGGTPIKIGGHTTMEIISTIGKSNNKKEPIKYNFAITTPSNFDPINNKYTIVQMAVSDGKDPIKSMPRYTLLVKEANCILVTVDVDKSSRPQYDIYKILDEKWGVIENQWPIAYYGTSGGAKRSTYNMAVGAKIGLNTIGAYLAGCNEDRSSNAMEAYRMTSTEKKRYRNGSFWLSCGAKDKIAPPSSQQRVVKSLKENRFKNVHLENFPGGHILNKKDLVKALNWMLEQQQEAK